MKEKKPMNQPKERQLPTPKEARSAVERAGKMMKQLEEERKGKFFDGDEEVSTVIIEAGKPSSLPPETPPQRKLRWDEIDDKGAGLTGGCI